MTSTSKGVHRSPGATLQCILVLALLTAACGSESSSTLTSPGVASLILPVRVHVLSSRVPPLDAGLTDSDVRALVNRVNEIWAQADVFWQLESIRRETVGEEDQVEQAVLGLLPLTSTLLAAIAPRGELTTGDWDVFLVADLTTVVGFPGVFFPAIPGILSSRVDPAGLGDPGRILAHELGHSLTLQHVPCTPAGDLMAPGCDSADRTRLDSGQIQQARTQAETGRPTSS